MPVYNEVATVEQAIDEVLATDIGLDIELVVVDDGSTDGTREILERTLADRVRLLQHERNRARARPCGPRWPTRAATSRRSSTPTSSTTRATSATCCRRCSAADTNAVFGVRAFDGYTSHSFLFVLGNKGVTLVANVLFNVYLRDLMTCHKAIRTDVFRSLPLHATGFEIEPEIAARLLQRGERIFEVPVHYKARGSDEGKKLTAADGLRVVATLLRCRFSRQ